MPEGDSIFQLSHRMQFLTGRKILASSFRVPQLATTHLEPRQVTKVWPYGKHLFMQCEDLILHTHLKMEGTWSVQRKGDKWRKPGHTARVVLDVEDAQGPIEVVGHELGFVRLFPTTEYAAKIAHLGPDVLADDWLEAGVHEAKRRILAKPDRAIGLALLDQKVLAGVGNEYRAEICFIAGIHPATRVRDVDVDAVLRITRRLMWENRYSPIRVTTGVRRAGESTYAFGRYSKPCRRCGAPIQKSTLVDNPESELERIIWWCPNCQPLPK